MMSDQYAVPDPSVRILPLQSRHISVTSQNRDAPDRSDDGDLGSLACRVAGTIRFTMREDLLLRTMDDSRQTARLVVAPGPGHLLWVTFVRRDTGEPGVNFAIGPDEMREVTVMRPDNFGVVIGIGPREVSLL